MTHPLRTTVPSVLSVRKHGALLLLKIVVVRRRTCSHAISAARLEATGANGRWAQRVGFVGFTQRANTWSASCKHQIWLTVHPQARPPIKGCYQSPRGRRYGYLRQWCLDHHRLRAGIGRRASLHTGKYGEDWWMGASVFSSAQSHDPIRHGQPTCTAIANGAGCSTPRRTWLP